MNITVNQINYFSGMLQIPVPWSYIEPLQELQQETLKGKQIIVNLKVKRKRRSLNANNYCWVLCQKIAEELSKDGQIHTKEDIYRKAIRDYSKPSLYATVDADRVHDIISLWESRGVGWCAEKSTARGDEVDVMLYKGSSLYDTAEMTRLINGLINDATELGLDVLTPAQKLGMLESWEKDNVSKDNG